jgi:hypothetical protein
VGSWWLVVLGPGGGSWDWNEGGGIVLIDCDRCAVRDIACSDCVVTAILRMPGPKCEIGEAEGRALRVLADARLVSPLRLRERLPRAS